MCVVDLQGLTDWLPADRPAEFAAVVLVAVLTSAFARRASFAEERGAMPLYFIVDLSAVLRFGASAALLVASIRYKIASLPGR